MDWQAVDLCGFGRLTRAPALACAPHSREALIDTLRHTRDNHGLICHAGGRSYGDAALNSGGRVILTAGLNRVLSFDPGSGEIVCEPGVTFHDLLRDFLPRGFVAPVSPGTGYATIGVTWKHGVAYDEDQILITARTEDKGAWSKWIKVDYHDDHVPSFAADGIA